MVLTFNYGDLQKIKKLIIEDKNKSDKNFYIWIESFKETINYMYENNLVKDISKEDLETELQEFAKSMLSKSKLSYRELEKKYRFEIYTRIIIKTDEIKLKI